MPKKPLILALLAGLALSGAAQATLFDRGGGMIYDDVLKITWLKDANYAKTSGYDPDGLMNWTDANGWAYNLSYGGFDDWRLPTTLQPDPSCSAQFDPGSPYAVQGLGASCTGSEMGELFYTEGGLSAGQSIVDSATLTSHFTNMQAYAYWSGTEFAPNTSFAWMFVTDRGFQLPGGSAAGLYAWAVRPGDVAAAPEPSTLVLLGLAMAGLGALRRRG